VVASSHWNIISGYQQIIIDNSKGIITKGYIRINAFDASYGTESCALSFIVNRPQNEPGFYLERQEADGRQIRYTIKSYITNNSPQGARY
jgi:ribulose-bisphosphate carboxylase small chain